MAKKKKDTEYQTSVEYVCLHEFAKEARKKCSNVYWDYLTGGAETETTLRRNRMALDTIAFRPRVLRNVDKVDPSWKFMGRKLRLPVMLAPIGGIARFDPDGGAAVMRAAGNFGVPYMMAALAEPGIEEIGAAHDGLKMYQLYIKGDKKWILEIVKRVADSGFNALAVTVDSSVGSRRERDISKRFVRPWHTKDHYKWRSGFTWDTVKWLQDNLDLPLFLKGIACAEDAAIAVEHGVEGVYVSNHGGRQPDHTRGSVAVLPEVVAEVKGKALVLVDGGFVRGTDIIKAIILGADMVGVGRLHGYALAADGEAGVYRMLELLEREIIVALGLLGVTKFAELDDTYLHHDAPAVTEPHILSAFPLLDLEDKSY